MAKIKDEKMKLLLDIIKQFYDLVVKKVSCFALLKVYAL